MILKKKIPRDFYKLFRTQNMEYYMQLLTALYEADQEAYALTQLTDSECRSILAETIARVNLVWWEDETEKTEDEGFPGLSPSAVLDRFVKWGWLSKDFDEKLKKGDRLMAIIYLNDKNKVETVSYKNIIMDMRTKMDESFKIEEQAYRMAAEYAEELIKEYSIETGPFYLTPSSFYENIEDAEGVRKYVFLSEDGAYTLAIGLDVSSCDQEASVLYLHNTEQ